MHSEADPASYSRGLLEALRQLVTPSAEDVWAVVVEFVEPLCVLRQTLRMWEDSPTFHAGLAEVVEDVLLMLNPEVCCETFRRTPEAPHLSICCDDLPGPFQGQFSFVLTGPVVSLELGAAPCVAFSHPWIGGVPLAAARRQAEFVEAACDVIGSFIQHSRASRVSLKVSSSVLAALEPVPTWLLSVGFVFTGEGLRSPTS